MGQSSSTNRPNAAPTQSNAESGQVRQEQPTAGPSTNSTSRRSSVRKSFLNLVKHRSSNDNNRRSWRHSRRFSKLPQSEPDSLQTQDVAPSEKGKEREMDSPAGVQLSEEDEAAPGPETESRTETLANRLGLSRNSTMAEEEVVISPEQFELPPSPPSPSQSDSNPPAVAASAIEDSQQAPSSNNNNTNRQFPPPGTLVVVQGVVHTTDIPRPPISTANASETPGPAQTESTERPSTPAGSERSRSRARNRLSALLRSRPNSIIARPESAAADLSSSSAASSEESSSSATPDTSLTETSAQNSSAISSSSIDVLGTLLSVAAAATAASLLTGSSEPMQTSGLGPSPIPPLEAGDPTNIFGPSRPTSPTPTAGLSGGLESAHGRAERMRQAWGSIRERLGLRPEPRPSTSPLGLPTAGTDRELDARERMLADMTRAFNMGLGIGNDSPASPSPASPALPAPSEASANAGTPAPPEGSFERFLVDLQADLRVALTQPSTPNPEPESQAESSGELSRTEDNAVQEEEIEAETESDSESEAEEETETLTPADQPAPEEADAPAQNDERPETDRGRINWWRLYRFPAIVTPRMGTPMPTPATEDVPPLAEAQPAATEVAAEPSTEAERSTTPTSPRPTLNVVVPVIVVGLQSVNMGWTQLAQAGAIPHLPNPNQTLPTTTNEAPTDDADQEPFEDLREPNDEAASSPPAGRRWHARAANALRGFRSPPVNRQDNEPQGNPNATVGLDFDGPGTRTFLIYVIGGYYPPDHTIVTGEPSNLESFEALLDLAELLGQVKPPTVSKEEIEKSGLEVIKATQVAEYEERGKVASNCTERCLICLDEYEPENDIRVLTCRHAFHMDCVDKWLQTGRNSCPACRSKGVSSPSPSPSSPVPEASPV